MGIFVFSFAIVVFIMISIIRILYKEIYNMNAFEYRINSEVKKILAQLIMKLYPSNKKLITNYLEKNMNLFPPDLYAQTICKDGRHRLFWNYIDEVNSCVQKQKCKNCQLIIGDETRIQHEFYKAEWIFVADNSCEKRKACIRDGVLSENQENIKISHESFSDWEYISANSCEQIRKCDRCGTAETRILHESLSDWEYASADSCEQTRKCGRCGIEETRIVHDYSFGICSRCKTIDSNYHICSFVPGPGTSDVCSICGQETNQYF